MEDDGTVQVCFMTSGGHPDRDVAVTVQPVDTADAVSACGTPQAFGNGLIVYRITIFSHCIIITL